MPVDVFGNSPKITFFGLLNPAIFSLQNKIISSSVAFFPGANSTKAQGVSPHFSSGFATTATSDTAGCFATTFSTSTDDIFSPPEIIISGGENISSVEVENVVAKHPAVSLVAVVAKPDEKWGETPCAFVELAPGKEASEDEIISFCKENMAGFKRPKYVIFGELPKTSTGKIQKFELRKKAKEI